MGAYFFPGGSDKPCKRPDLRRVTKQQVEDIIGGKIHVARVIYPDGPAVMLYRHTTQPHVPENALATSVARSGKYKIRGPALIVTNNTAAALLKTA